MAAASRRTGKSRNRKRVRAGKDRKRKLRVNGSTPSLDDILGPSKK